MTLPEHAPRSIGDAAEDWLATLAGPARLAAFGELPGPMQMGAWSALRRQVEADRESEREQAA